MVVYVARNGSSAVASVSSSAGGSCERFGSWGEWSGYVGPDAVALLEAAGLEVPEGMGPVAVRVSRVVDMDADCPREWDGSRVSWAVTGSARRARGGLPDEWTGDGHVAVRDPLARWGYRTVVPELGAELVAEVARGRVESYESDPLAVAVRLLSLSGARGVASVDLCEHSGQWLSWRFLGGVSGYVAGSEGTSVGDALVWVPAESIAEDFRDASGRRVHFRGGRWVTVAGGVDVSAEVEAWARESVAGDVGEMDIYVRGDVSVVEVEVVTDPEDVAAAAAGDWDVVAGGAGSHLCGGIFGDDASIEWGGYGAVDVLGEAWAGAVESCRESARAAASTVAGGVYVI